MKDNEQGPSPLMSSFVPGERGEYSLNSSIRIRREHRDLVKCKCTFDSCEERVQVETGCEPICDDDMAMFRTFQCKTIQCLSFGPKTVERQVETCGQLQ